MTYNDLANARPTLKRILERNDLSDLSAVERQTLERLAGIRTSGEDDGARPLWFWIRDGAWEAPSFARLAFFGAIDEKLDVLMTTCGVLASPSETVVGRLLTPITRTALQRGLLVQLQEQSDVMACGVSALVAAFAGFRAAIPHIERLLPEEAGISLRPLIRPNLTIAMSVFGVENLLEILGPSDQHYATAAMRLTHLSRRGSAVRVDEIPQALGEDGWTLESIQRYPSLLHHYARSGGDMSALVGQIANTGVFSWLGPMHSSVAVSLARALMSVGDEAVVNCLEILNQIEPPPDDLLKHLYAEFARLRCTAALAPLRVRLSSMDQDQADDSGEAHHRINLLWPAGVLDPAGPTWLEGLIRSNPDDESLVAAGALLAVAREDASHLLPASDAEGLSKPLRTMALIARSVIAGEPDAALRLAANTGERELGTLAHVLYCAADLGGRPTAVIAALMELLRDPDEYETAHGAAVVDQYVLLRLLDLLECGGHGVQAILCRIRHVPSEFAAGILQGIIARINSMSDGTTQAMLRDLSLIELGCVENFEHLVSVETLAVVRLHAAHFPRGVQLPEPERSVALSMLAAAGEPFQRRLASLLEGDVAFDAVAAALLYRGAVGGTESIRTSRDSFDILFRAIAPSERLATVIQNPSVYSGTEQAVAAATLMASPSTRIRKLALPLLFTNDASATELMPLREVYVRDGDDDVQVALLGEIGQRPFTPAEIRLILSNALAHFGDPSGSWTDPRGTRARTAAARAIARLNKSEYVDLLFPMMRDASGEVVTEAQAALRAVLSAGASDLVLFSISDPSAISERFGLPRPNLLATFSDKRGEGMRLLLLAVEQRADAAYVHKHAGRRLLMSPVRSWPPAIPGGAVLKQYDFERLALHLHVLLVDAESGSIVAEVGKEPTGEILNAVFETSDFTLLQVVWG